jgi:hypothetical protein
MVPQKNKPRFPSQLGLAPPFFIYREAKSRIGATVKPSSHVIYLESGLVKPRYLRTPYNSTSWRFLLYNHTQD